jgi:hypothetical protein
MKSTLKSTAIVTAIMFTLAVTDIAQAADRSDDRDRRSGPSTTEKVIGALAVGAIAGLAIYAATRDDDRRHHRYYRDQYRDSRRSYLAFEFGYSSPSRGHWVNHRGMRFYRAPYRYNPRFDRAYNAGWERGYWAGYLQGMHDGRHRARYDDRFYRQGRHVWGYAPAFGPHNSYERAFHAAFSIGYRHAWRGRPYGYEGFGFSIHFGYRR